MKYIKTSNRFVLAFFITIILTSTFVALSPWSIEKIIRSATTTTDALVIPSLYLFTYTSLFFISSLSLRKHQGWKRLTIILIIISGIAGGYIAYDGRGFNKDDVGEVFIGVLIGLFISLVLFEIGSMMFRWVKQGFDAQP